MTVALVAVSAGVSSALAVLVLVALARRLRARLRAEESDARELAAPHLVPLSDEHARAIAHAIEAKARRRAGISAAPALALLAMLSGCSPWAAAGAIADGAKMAIGGYTIWYEARADKVLAGADQCKGLVALDAAVCASKALAPLRAQQEPVLKCLPTAKPLVLAAADAAEAHDDQAAKSLLPDLVEKVRPCVAAIKAAQKAAATATPGGTP